MLKSLNLTIIILFTLSLLACKNEVEITEVINPIKLVVGKADSVIISDLFYSDSYDIELSENNEITAKYNSNKKMIFLKADSNFTGMNFIEFKLAGKNFHIPVIVSKENYYSFHYKPTKKYDKLNLFGSFNGWNRTNIPMMDNDGDGIFEATVALEPGIYQYKFFADGEELVDPENPNKISNGAGSFNSIRSIEDPNSEKFYLHIDEFYSKNPQSVFSFYVEDELEGKLTINNIFILLNNNKVSQDKVSLDGKYISVNFNYDELENQTLRVAVSKNGRVANIQTIKLKNGKPISNDTFTWSDGIIYSLMIDRFNDGNPENNNPVKHDSLFNKANYMGGDLQGVLNKLNEGYFDSLGINIIWISPIYDNPNEAFKEYPAPHRYYSGYHGYWPISDRRVEEHFGNLDDVKQLVATAQKKGIKVLLDFVSNHVHEQHPFFQEHRDWFGTLELPDGRLNLRFWDEFRLTTWFEPYLASFDYLGSEEALEVMTDNAVWWLKETGADGYRHDAVKHVPNKFWRRLNEKIKKEVASERNLPVYQIGETFGSYDLISSYVNNGQLNAQFNFNLYDVAIPTFTRKGESFETLDKEMSKTFSVYGINHVMGNVMDSHDKNRFMAYADNDLDASEWSAAEVGWTNPPMVNDAINYKKLVLYMAYMNSIPGLPVIYYGSEFGMSGASDPDNRRMMRFDEDLSEDEKKVHSEVAKIINLRREHTALRHGDYYTLFADENIYAYLRSDFNERILVTLNKGDKKEIKLTLPEGINVTVLKNVVDGSEINVNENSVMLELDKISWGMYLLK